MVHISDAETSQILEHMQNNFRIELDKNIYEFWGTKGNGLYYVYFNKIQLVISKILDIKIYTILVIQNTHKNVHFQ